MRDKNQDFISIFLVDGVRDLIGLLLQLLTRPVTEISLGFPQGILADVRSVNERARIFNHPTPRQAMITSFNL